MLFERGLSLILSGTLVLSSSVLSMLESPLDAVRETEADSSIVEFVQPEPLENDYKLSLERQKELLPDVLTAVTEDGECLEVEVEDWVPECDYDELLGQYTFSPVVDEELILEAGLELPIMTVFVEDEEEPDYSGYEEIDLGYEVPILGAAFDEDAQDANTGDFYIKEASESYYNGFEEGYLPVVKSQGAEGACWAFATIGALETDFIRNQSDSNDLDLSELQLCYYETHEYEDPTGANSGEDRDKTTYIGNANSYMGNGGTAAVAYRIMANGVGPVEEKYAPYSAGYNYVPDKDDALNRNYGRVEYAYNLNSLDHEAIKAAILEHGGVTASFYSKSSYYSATYNSYYQNSISNTNHEIMLVGWDDNFSSDNFLAGKPQGDGAWLVRNSYGLNDYGFKGYFWISYYDKCLMPIVTQNGDKETVKNRTMTVYDVEKTTYDNTYSHVHEFSKTGIQTLSGASSISTSYYVNGGEAIKAVGIELASANNDVTVAVTCGSKTVSGYVRTTYAGYYTIPLTTPLVMEKSGKVTLSFNISSYTGGESKIIFEYASNGNSVVYSNIKYEYVCNQPTLVNYVERKYDLFAQLYTDDTAVKTESETDADKLVLSDVFIYEYGGAVVALSLLDADTLSQATVNSEDLVWTSSNEKTAIVDDYGNVCLGYDAGSCIVRCKYKGETIGECTVAVRPRFLSYEVEDGARFTQKAITYYPNAERSGTIKLSIPYREGFNFLGWSFNEDLSGEVFKEVAVTSLLANAGEDAKTHLYPKWEPLSLKVYYYSPKDDMTGFTNDSNFMGTVSGDELPFSTMSLLSGCKNPLDYIPTINAEKDHFVKYFSFDPEGKKPADEINYQAFDMHRAISNGDSGSYYVQADSVYLYPQIERFPRIDAPESSISTESFVEEGTSVTLSVDEECEGKAIYYRLGDGEYITYTEPIVFTKSMFDSEGVLTITAYANASSKSKSNEVSMVFYYKDPSDESLWGDVDPSDLVNYAKENNFDTPNVEMIEDAGFWLGGIDEEKIYTGKAITFDDLKVYYKNRLLILATDYTVKYTNNIAAAEFDAAKPPTITITGKGGYSGKLKKTFTIKKADISECVEAPDRIYGFYNKGKVVKPSFKLIATIDGVTRTLGTKDYSYACRDYFDAKGCKSVGVHRLVVSGQGNYTGVKVLNFEITLANPMSKATVSVKNPGAIDNWQTPEGGYLVKPEVVVKYGKNTVLIPDEDYTLEFINNDRVGTASLIVTGKSDGYVGSKTVNFKITGTSITSKYKLTGFTSSFVYSGQPVLQKDIEFTVKDKPLVKDVDYKVSYSKVECINAGSYYLIITGIGRYYGTIKKKFTITPYNLALDPDKVMSVSVENVLYEKGGVKPAPLVRFKENTLTLGKDYTVSYLNNTKVNENAIVMIKGKGNFKGTQTKAQGKTFSISAKSLDSLNMVTKDVKLNSKYKPLQYRSTFTIYDTNNKALKAGTDYYNGKGDIKYSLDPEGNVELTNDASIEVGTVIYVTVRGKGNYTGQLTGSYRVCRYLISEMKLTVSPKTYTGEPVTLEKADVTLSHKNLSSEEITYVIADDYKNNIKKGTATVTIKGTGEIGGTRTVSIKIVSRPMQ